MKNLQSDDFRVPITDEVIEEKKNQLVNEKKLFTKCIRNSCSKQGRRFIGSTKGS